MKIKGGSSEGKGKKATRGVLGKKTCGRIFETSVTEGQANDKRGGEIEKNKESGKRSLWGRENGDCCTNVGVEKLEGNWEQ